MGGLFKFIVWGGLAFGLGIYVSTVRYPDGTLLEQATRLAQRHAPTDLPSLAGPRTPTEQHSAEDRDAVKALIVKRGETGKLPSKEPRTAR